MFRSQAGIILRGRPGKLARSETGQSGRLARSETGQSGRLARSETGQSGKLARSETGQSGQTGQSGHGLTVRGHQRRAVVPAMTPPPMEHIILSPHYDDAALSCGGMIAQRAAAGDPVVVATVFGGQPDLAALSPFAQSIHARPGAAGDLIAQRVAEEKQALAILHAQPRPGSYLDCIYRREEANGRWLYDREEALFGPVDAADEALVDELAAVFAALAPPAGQCVIYAPLAVGCHVDHQVVQWAAMKLLPGGYEVLFYEDYPYVVRDPAGLPAALGRVATAAGWQPRPVALSREELDRKIAAVTAYASQLGVLFGRDGAASPQDVAGVLDGFARFTARETETGRFAERFWSPARSA